METTNQPTASSDITLQKIKFPITDKQNIGFKKLCLNKYKYYKLWGGARSGKTFLAIIYIFSRALVYRNTSHLVCRYASTIAKKTVWRQTILPLALQFEAIGICKIHHTEGLVRFINGSIISLGGLRPAESYSLLSSEYQTIHIVEANENSWDIVEQMMTRLNGTQKDKAGKIIQTKFIIDLNPTTEKHWTNQVWMKGINPKNNEPVSNYAKLCNLHFRPEDNQVNLSADYIEDLKALSSTKRLRFYEGQYGSIENLVYHNFGDENICHEFDIPKDFKLFYGIDFGYNHPFVCLAGAYSQSDEKVYIFSEYIQTERTVKNHSEILKELHGKDFGKINRVICDHDAEDRATLRENGINNFPANKDVKSGIDRMTDLIERRKLVIFRSCVSTIQQFYEYKWQTKNDVYLRDRQPVKENDDIMDALRYMVMDVFKPRQKIIIDEYGY